jgi:hypothetical protein
MSRLDDNIHGYLHRGVGVQTTRLRGHLVRRSLPSVGCTAASVENEKGTCHTLIPAQLENPQLGNFQPKIPLVRKRHTQTLIPTNGYFYGLG